MTCWTVHLCGVFFQDAALEGVKGVPGRGEVAKEAEARVAHGVDVFFDMCAVGAYGGVLWQVEYVREYGCGPGCVLSLIHI